MNSRPLLTIQKSWSEIWGGAFKGITKALCACAHVYVLLELCNRFTGLVFIYFKNMSVSIHYYNVSWLYYISCSNNASNSLFIAETILDLSTLLLILSSSESWRFFFFFWGGVVVFTEGSSWSTHSGTSKVQAKGCSNGLQWMSHMLRRVPCREWGNSFLFWLRLIHHVKQTSYTTFLRTKYLSC